MVMLVIVMDMHMMIVVKHKEERRNESWSSVGAREGRVPSRQSAPLNAALVSALLHIWQRHDFTGDIFHLRQARRLDKWPKTNMPPPVIVI